MLTFWQSIGWLCFWTVVAVALVFNIVMVMKSVDGLRQTKHRQFELEHLKLRWQVANEDRQRFAASSPSDADIEREIRRLLE